MQQQMPMPKILHTADWQIGRSYGAFDPEDAVPLAEARFAAVERIAALATAEAVDAVVVAGDVFDAQTLSARCIRRLFNALSGYAGPWVMIPGNHDAALAESVWSQAARLEAVPPNARVALQPQVVELDSVGLAILCAPLSQRHTYDDLTAWFDLAETPPGWARVGVAHGAVQGLLAEDIDSANPIAPDRAVRARLDYLALGDWHGMKRIDERTWYSGTPEPDRFKANDAGHVLLVTLGPPGSPPHVEARRIAQFRWEQQEYRLSVATDVDALVEGLSRIQADLVLDLTVSGLVDLEQHARLQQAFGAAEARARSLRRDLGGLQLAPTANDIAALQADGYLGEVVTELHALTSEGTGEAAGRARDALVLLAGLLAERHAEEASA